MPDYQKGKIYAIRSHQTDKIYIGSTTTKLSRRLTEHKKTAVTSTSKEILKYEDAYIELIENFPCNSKEELNKREGEHIRSNNCVNKVIIGRTYKEWYEENKSQISEKHKILWKDYYEKNRERLIEKSKEYRKKTYDKQKISEYNKQYREKRKMENNLPA